MIWFTPTTTFFFFTPFMSLALVAEGLTSVTFIKRMGLGRATEALLEGRKMTAPELKESGFITRLYTKPAGFDGKDKLATPPIFDDVLKHVKDKFLPPNASPFSLLYTKKLLNDAAYAYSGVDGVNQAELVSANLALSRWMVIPQLTADHVLRSCMNREEQRPSLPRAHRRSASKTSPAVHAISFEAPPLVTSNITTEIVPCSFLLLCLHLRIWFSSCQSDHSHTPSAAVVALHCRDRSVFVDCMLLPALVLICDSSNPHRCYPLRYRRPC